MGKPGQGCGRVLIRKTLKGGPELTGSELQQNLMRWRVAPVDGEINQHERPGKKKESAGERSYPGNNKHCKKKQRTRYKMLARSLGVKIRLQ